MRLQPVMSLHSPSPLCCIPIGTAFIVLLGADADTIQHRSPCRSQSGGKAGGGSCVVYAAFSRRYLFSFLLLPRRQDPRQPPDSKPPPLRFSSLPPPSPFAGKGDGDPLSENYWKNST